ncbi:MAG: DUF309 domain-containing protein [Chthoniobacterales bacterium]
MKKTDRIAEFMAGLEAQPAGGVDPHLSGYFECFNSGCYYEAHDVLEHLWLGQGKDHPDYRFHKGLIQLAGGFVHLKLQFAHPDHPKHGQRLHPARRLFLLSITNLAPYGGRHQGLDLASLRSLAQETAALIEVGDFSVNPWSSDTPPRLRPPES